MSFCKGLVLALSLGLSGAVYAHGGEDHGETPAVAGPGLLPRVVMVSEDVELLGIASAPGELTLYLDEFASNRPIAQAAVELESAGRKLQAQETAPGVYRVQAPWLKAPGEYALVVSVTSESVLDLLNGKLVLPESEPGADDEHTPVPWRWLLAGLGLLFIAALVWRRRRGASVLLLAGTLALAGPEPVWAHGGEDHGEAAPTTGLVEGQPKRLPDGSLFLPKTTQRLLGIGTERVRRDQARRTLPLNGRVIADPNASGLVAANGPGRIRAGASGLPALGEHVKAGTVLAYLEPALSASERAARFSELAALKAESATMEARARRYAELRASIPAKDRAQAETEAAALRERVAALDASLNRAEPLLAPVSGVVGQRRISVGQVVAAGEILFTLASPDKRWIEAAAYDSTLAARVSGGELLVEGAVLPLRFLGAGNELSEQALPLQFAVLSGAERLALEQPVKVLAQLDETVDALTLPAAAVVRGADGLPAVFVHTAPERFVPHTLEIEPVAGGRVAVKRGLEAGDRVVTVGASLLAQVR